MSKTRTMYMHTLDGRPANIQRYTRGAVSFYYALARRKAKLYPSLVDIRSEQNEYLHYVASRGGDAPGELRSLGYVLVEVPR